MKGDFGTIHIELPDTVDDVLAEEIFEATTEIMDRFLEQAGDLMVSMHRDGPCDDSPHCWGAHERRLRERIATEIERRSGFGTAPWERGYAAMQETAASIARGAAK